MTLAIALTLMGSDARGAQCRRQLTLAGIERAIDLGAEFLARNQKKEGNFVYGYDWHARVMARGDSVVRQAGATWSLGLLVRTGEPSLGPPLERALRFFAKHGGQVDGRRFVRYPGDEIGSTGAVALLALAHLEHVLALRASGASTETVRWSRSMLDGYLAQLVASRQKAGGFASRYVHTDGRPLGPPSPYYDGESLLALVKVARYLGRRDLLPLALAEAESGYRRHVVQPRLKEPDPKTTKGYYQWHSMALWELTTWSATSSEADWGERLIELATWMLRAHRVLQRRRNTAYAFEGIVPAYAIAHQRGDARAAELACAIEEGLGKLSSWQVGSPTANATIRSHKPDERAMGGVQNHAREPLLRVDVTQHQMHALVLARRLYLPTLSP